MFELTLSSYLFIFCAICILCFSIWFISDKNRALFLKHVENYNKHLAISDPHSYKVHYLGKLVPNFLRVFIYQSSMVKNAQLMIFIFSISSLFFTFVFSIFFNFIVSLVASVLWSLLVSIILAIFKRNSWKQEFSINLLHSIVLLRDASKSGIPLMQALSIAEKEVHQVIREELSYITQNLSIGVPLEAVLEVVKNRVDDSTFNSFCKAILINYKVGGNLASMLDNLIELINTRKEVNRLKKELSQNAKSTNTIVLFVPILVGGFLLYINPDNVHFFFHTSEGNSLAILVLILIFMNFVFNQAIMKFMGAH